MTDRAATQEAFSLPPLPYDRDALSPHLSAETIDIHYGKHHARYIETLNRLAGKLATPPSTLEELIRSSRATDASLFNNAAQAWNHTFFWEGMCPQKTEPAGELKEAIARSFGSVEELKQRFVAEGAGHFGSGWVWLVSQNGDLSVMSTHDAENPVIENGATPLLTCDVWEHAYYIDCRQDRPGWLQKWWDHLANWNFAQEQFDASLGRTPGWTFASSGDAARK